MGLALHLIATTEASASTSTSTPLGSMDARANGRAKLATEAETPRGGRGWPEIATEEV